MAGEQLGEANDFRSALGRLADSRLGPGQVRRGVRLDAHLHQANRKGVCEGHSRKFLSSATGGCYRIRSRLSGDRPARSCWASNNARRLPNFRVVSISEVDPISQGARSKSRGVSGKSLQLEHLQFLLGPSLGKVNEKDWTSADVLHDSTPCVGVKDANARLSNRSHTGRQFGDAV
jgi:hypothetical protein